VFSTGFNELDISIQTWNLTENPHQ